MAVVKGNDIILKSGAVASTPTTIAAQRVTSLAINHEAVDITNKDSNRWKTLLEDAGGKSMTISITGMYDDTAILATMLNRAKEGSIDTYSLFFGEGSTMEGEFMITSSTFKGEYNGAQEYDMTLDSSAAVTLAAG